MDAKRPRLSHPLDSPPTFADWSAIPLDRRAALISNCMKNGFLDLPDPSDFGRFKYMAHPDLPDDILKRSFTFSPAASAILEEVSKDARFLLYLKAKAAKLAGDKDLHFTQTTLDSCVLAEFGFVWDKVTYAEIPLFLKMIHIYTLSKP